MVDSPRIQELKRRVQVDPASIAFAALAEEYRRAGRYEEAIATCEAGLQRHPAYLSARVTLGRALLELGRFDEARQELEHVLRAAPENLAAIRGLAEIHHRRGELPEALEQYRTALHVAKHDAELENAVEQISKQVSRPDEPAAATGAASPGAAPDRLPAHQSVLGAVEPPTRPHLELVARQPARPPEPEPELEPEPQVAPEPTTIVAAEVSAEEPHVAVAEAQHESYGESQHERDSEMDQESLDTPPGPVGAAAFADIPRDAVSPPSQPDAIADSQPDPALVTLEGLLGAILREKDRLVSPAAARR